MPRLLAPLLLAMAVVVSCKKENQTGVPPVGVDFSINVNLPEYAAIQVTGGWAYMSGGSLGLIVYRKSDTEFCVMDRHCPYMAENLCRVIVDESDILARDTACCASSFLIMDGSLVDGVSPFGLKTYHTMFNGSILRVYE